MYEEEKKNSFIKDFVIKLLYMFLFLFLFMWLYPAPKVNLDDIKVKVDKTELQPLFAGVFNDNINAMKESARSYYTIERLPKNNGDSTKMTLQEMLSKKMVAPFVDANGKTCDASSSYVEVTRISQTEYTLKVNLSCSDKTDYIIETIGCTSVCPGCVATPTPVTTRTVTNSGSATRVVSTQKPVTPSRPSQPSKPVNPSTPETKVYKYTKNVSEWELNSSWTRTRKTGSDVQLYRTRTVYGDTEYETRSYTYRTVSWVADWDRNSHYSIYLNNIPSNARNVRITSQSKFSGSSEIRNYINNRYRGCVINVVGSSCPRRTDASIIEDNRLYSTPLASFNYSLNLRRSGKWIVDVNANTYNSFYGDTQYLVPIKFTVK